MPENISNNFTEFFVPKVDKYPPEYVLVDTPKYRLVQAIIDHDYSKKFKPSDIYYIFYDKFYPSNTKLLEYEDKLNQEYYQHISETIAILKNTWRKETKTEVDPAIDLHALLQYNIEQHRERARVLSEVHRKELASIGIKSKHPGIP